MHMLRRYRLAKGWTQTQLANRIYITRGKTRKPLSVKTISAYESGLRRPSPNIYPKLADALSIDPFELTKIIEPERHPVQESPVIRG